MQRTPSANSSGPGPVSLSRARGSTRPRQMHSPGTQPGALTASWCSPARSRAVCANAGATPVSKASASQVIGTRSNLEILGTVPLMPDIPHDESTIELYTSLGESCLVGKVAGMYFLDLERLHPPAVGSKLVPVETSGLTRHGVPEGSGFKKAGGLGQRGETREAGKRPSRAPADSHGDFAIVGLHAEVDAVRVFPHCEMGGVMLPGEESAAGKPVHGGAGIPARNEDALLLATVVLPADSDPVGGVLTRETEELWHESRGDRFKAN